MIKSMQPKGDLNEDQLDDNSSFTSKLQLVDTVVKKIGSEPHPPLLPRRFMPDQYWSNYDLIKTL